MAEVVALDVDQLDLAGYVIATRPSGLDIKSLCVPTIKVYNFYDTINFFRTNIADVGVFEGTDNPQLPSILEFNNYVDNFRKAIEAAAVEVGSTRLARRVLRLLRVLLQRPPSAYVDAIRATYRVMEKESHVQTPTLEQFMAQPENWLDREERAIGIVGNAHSFADAHTGSRFLVCEKGASEVIAAIHNAGGSTFAVNHGEKVAHPGNWVWKNLARDLGRNRDRYAAAIGDSHELVLEDTNGLRVLT